MNNNAWFFLATPDVLTAQLIAPRSESPSEDSEPTPVPRVARVSRRVAPLFRRLTSAAA